MNCLSKARPGNYTNAGGITARTTHSAGSAEGITIMMAYETLNQKQRDAIHKAIADAARAVLVSYCGDRGNEYADHDDFLIEHIWDTADAISDDIDYHRRRECAADILDALHLAYDSGRIDDLVELLEANWDDAGYLMEKIRRHDLRPEYNWLYE